MALLHDTMPITGNAGVITAVIDGNVEVLAEVKSINANIAYSKTAYKVMGDPAERHKPGPWTGTGTATYHYVTSRWVKMIIDAANTRRHIFFTIVITNDDEGSGTGRQTVKLGRCHINGGDIAMVDTESEALESGFDFTFSETEGLEYFNEI